MKNMNVKRICLLAIVPVLIFLFSACTVEVGPKETNALRNQSQKEYSDYIPKTIKVENDSEKKQITVYVTKTGEKYHLAGCRSLSKSCIPISLSEAQANSYAPCKICNPPR